MSDDTIILEDTRKIIADLSVKAFKKNMHDLALKLDRCVVGLEKAILVLKDNK